MVGLLAASITFCLILLVVKHSKKTSVFDDEFSQPVQDDKTVKVNGIDIGVSQSELDEINRQKEQQEFESAVNTLKDIICDDMNETSDIIRHKVLEALYRRPIITKEDLVELDFLYNDGQLRTNEEVEYFNHWKETKNKRDNFDDERHTTNLLSFVIPFVITFVLVIIGLSDSSVDVPFVAVIALIPAIFIGMIGLLVGNSINIKKAKDYCIPDDDPAVVDEKLKRSIGIASTIGTGFSIKHKVKKGVKDIMNVDSWQEMK